MLVILHEKHNKKNYYYIANKTIDGKETNYEIITGALNDRKDAERRMREIERGLRCKAESNKGK